MEAAAETNQSATFNNDADVKLADYVDASPSLTSTIARVASVVHNMIVREHNSELARQEERRISTPLPPPKRARTGEEDGNNSDMKKESDLSESGRQLNNSIRALPDVDVVQSIVWQFLVYGVCAFIMDADGVYFPRLSISASSDVSYKPVITTDTEQKIPLASIAWIRPSWDGKWLTPIAAFHRTYTRNPFVRIMRQATAESLITMRTPMLIMRREPDSQDVLRSATSAKSVSVAIAELGEAMTGGGTGELYRPLDAVLPPAVTMLHTVTPTLFHPRHGPTFRHVSRLFFLHANPRLVVTNGDIRSLTAVVNSVVDKISLNKPNK